MQTDGAWLSYLLVLLKVVGVVGAFYSLSRHNAGTPANRFKYVPLAFLAVAIGAELIDAELKRRSAQALAFRFERLARPLGTIAVRAHLQIPLTSPALKNYRATLQQWAASQSNGSGNRDSHCFHDFPEPAQDDFAAHTATRFIPMMGYFFVSKPVHLENSDDWEPDLSFRNYPGMDGPLFRTREEDRRKAESKVLQAACVSNDFSTLDVPLETIVNEPSDRFSNGEIISTLDLLGGQLIVQLCPIATGSRRDHMTDRDYGELISSFRVSHLSIEFPGSQELQLGEKELVPVKTSKDTCTRVSYDFPKAKEEWKRKLTP